MNPTTPPIPDLQAFGAHYDYDVSYLVDLANDSPPAFDAFHAAQALSQVRDTLPLDAHYVTRITTMQTEDCGACAQLNVRMAVEAGIDRDLLRQLIERPDELPPRLRDVRDHARAIVAADGPDPERSQRLRDAFGDAGFAEIGALIAGCRIYPTLKRALGRDTACTRLNVDFD